MVWIARIKLVVRHLRVIDQSEKIAHRKVIVHSQLRGFSSIYYWLLHVCFKVLYLQRPRYTEIVALCLEVLDL